MRGNRRQSLCDVFGPRSIPARAGEPLSGTLSIVVTWVYPRACGGTLGKPADAIRKEGLSPRVRGNRDPGFYSEGILRSIPARAGEPPA